MSGPVQVALSTADLLVRVRTLQAGLRKAEDDLRQKLLTEMAPGDRRMGTGPVRDGKVTLSAGGEWSVQVTDVAELTEWVITHYPDHVEPTVKPWALEEIKRCSVAAGAPCGPGGELVPGVDLVQTNPELKVFASRPGAVWVAERWAEVVAGLPVQLTAGDE